MATKIAPLVCLAVDSSTYPFPGAVNGERARAQLRALLAVARQAQKQADHGNNWPAVLRALARLSRVSGGGNRRGGR